MNTTLAIRKAFRVQRYRRRYDEVFSQKVAIKTREALVDAINEQFSLQRSGRRQHYALDWQEEQHPRDTGGQFSETEGGGFAAEEGGVFDELQALEKADQIAGETASKPPAETAILNPSKSLDDRFDEEENQIPAKVAEPIAQPARIGGIDAPSIQTLPDGRKVGVTMLTVDELSSAPDRFQYKVQGIGNEGVTETLKEVQKFRPEFAGQLLAWHDPQDGQTYIVNGHHRFELAMRSGYQGPIPTFLIDAADEKEARAMGALANIAEGNGTSIDAAKFFREMDMSVEKVREEGISMKGRMADEGVVLAKLSDSAFAALVNDQLDEKFALSIARNVKEHDKQDQLFRQIHNAEQSGKKLRQDVVEEMARVKGLTESVVETQTDMFGTEEVERSLDVERATITAAIMRDLGGEARTFTEVGRRGRAAALEQAGNVLDPEANRQRAQTAQQLHGLFRIESTHKGEISDAINEETRQLANEPKREKEIIRDATRRIRSLLSQTNGGAEDEDAAPLQGNPGPSEGDRPDPERARFGLRESLTRLRFSMQLRHGLEALRYRRPFDESKHQRADDGKFGSGGGTTPSDVPPAKAGQGLPPHLRKSLDEYNERMSGFGFKTTDVTPAGYGPEPVTSEPESPSIEQQLERQFRPPESWTDSEFSIRHHKAQHPVVGGAFPTPGSNPSHQPQIKLPNGATPAQTQWLQEHGYTTWSTGGKVWEGKVVEEPDDPRRPKTLGIPRQDMPQIAGPDKKEFFDFLSSKGIDYRTKEVRVGDLKGTQKDFSQEKVDAMAEGMRRDGVRPGSAMLASNDGFILDGHHRWRAQREVDPDSMFSVVEVDLPIDQLLATAASFPKSFKAGIDEGAGPRDYGERQKEMFARIQHTLLRYGYQQARDDAGRFATSNLEKSRAASSTATQVEPGKPHAWTAPPQPPARGGSWSENGDVFTPASGDKENRYGANRDIDAPCFEGGCYDLDESGQIDYAAWREELHPRDADGKFGSGNGSNTPGKDAQDPTSQQSQSTDLSEIHRHYPPANPAGRDTQSQYKVGDHYTPERQRLHSAIIAKRLQGVTKSDEPTVWMLGGGSASGKSTMVREGAVVLPDNAVHVDPDEIKSEIPEYGAMVQGRDLLAAPFVHEESSDVSKQLIRRGLESSFDLVLDTTGDSSIEKLRGKIRKWRESGHRIVANYATVPTEVAIERANARAAKTGRFVDADVIRTIHAGVSQIIPQAISEGLFDEFRLFDTSSKPGKLIASAQGSQLEVHDQQLWEGFLQKGQV